MYKTIGDSSDRRASLLLSEIANIIVSYIAILRCWVARDRREKQLIPFHLVLRQTLARTGGDCTPQRRLGRDKKPPKVHLELLRVPTTVVCKGSGVDCNQQACLLNATVKSN